MYPPPEWWKVDNIQLELSRLIFQGHPLHVSSACVISAVYATVVLQELHHIQHSIAPLSPAPLHCGYWWHQPDMSACIRTRCTVLYSVSYFTQWVRATVVMLYCISESLGSRYSNLRSLAAGSAYSAPQWTARDRQRGTSLPLQYRKAMAGCTLEKKKIAYSFTVYLCLFTSV